MFPACPCFSGDRHHYLAGTPPSSVSALARRERGGREQREQGERGEREEREGGESEERVGREQGEKTRGEKGQEKRRSVRQQLLPVPSQNAAGERAFVGLWSRAKLVWPSSAKIYTGRILCALNACFTQTSLFFPVDENLVVKTKASLKHSGDLTYIILDLLSLFSVVLPEPLSTKYFNDVFSVFCFQVVVVRRNNSLHAQFIGKYEPRQ